MIPFLHPYKSLVGVDLVIPKLNRRAECGFGFENLSARSFGADSDFMHLRVKCLDGLGCFL
jgi:hypothetical protein